MREPTAAKTVELGARGAGRGSRGRGRVLLPVAALAAAAACASKQPAAPADDPPQPTLASLQAKVFSKQCADSGCHGIDFPKQGVALYNESVTTSTMINRPPTVGDASRFYTAIVLPGDPDHSFLIEKVTEPGPTHGLRMPTVGAPLSAATVDAMRAWIASLPK